MLKSDESPDRKVKVTVLEESGVQVIVKAWPATMVVPASIELMTFWAAAHPMKTRSKIFATENILRIRNWGSDTCLYGEPESSERRGLNCAASRWRAKEVPWNVKNVVTPCYLLYVRGLPRIDTATPKSRVCY